MMPCGTTGEGALLSDDEVAAVVDATVGAAERAARVYAHIGRPGTPPTLRLAESALQSGADSVFAAVPYYYALEDSQVLEHYAALIQTAGNAKAYAYNIPSHTGNDLTPAVTAKLAAGGLAGIKDSTKSMDRHREYLDLAGHAVGFEVFMGSDASALESYRGGSAGSVSAVANARPELFVELRDAFVEGRHDDAGRVQEEIGRVRNELTRGRRFVGLKRDVSEVLRSGGASYPAFVRRPLG